MANLSVAMLADAASKKILCLIDAATNGVWALRGANTQELASGDKIADLAVIANGEIAHDAADSGNPIKVGGKAEATIPTAVADGDRVDANFDLYGRPRVSPDSLIGYVFSRNGAASEVVDAGEEKEILALPDVAYVVDFAEFVTNHVDLGLRLYYWNGATYDLIKTITSATTSAAFHVDHVQNVGSWMFDVLCYDTSNNIYKLELKRPITFPLGFKVTAYNRGGDAHRCMCQLAYRALR